MIKKISIQLIIVWTLLAAATATTMENLILLAVQYIFSYIHFTDLVIISVVSLFLCSFIRQKFTSNGPILWPMVGILPSILLHANELHEWNASSLIKAGGTYRFRGIMISKLRGVVTCDPAKIEYMLKARFHNFPKGDYYRERFRELLGDGIFNADGDVWKDQRRVAATEMHSSRFMVYSAQVIQDLVHEKLLKLIEKKAKAGDHGHDDHRTRAIDLQEWLLRFTFDNVCLVAFGIDPGCLAMDSPDQIPFAKAFEEATQYSALRFLFPPFVWKPMRYLNVGSERRLKEAVKIVHEFVESAVKNRKVDVIINANSGSSTTDHQNMNGNDDLLSRLVRLRLEDEAGLQQGKGLKSSFSDKFLRDFCISFILAGRDTSSMALTWFFWLLHNNPDVEKNIVDEISRIVQEKHDQTRERGLTREDDIIFEAEELEKMVYLHSALTEAMRLYPPVPIDFKEVLEDDVYPDGLRIHKGERIFYHIYAMARMESIWGKDCKEFKPERWIKDGRFVIENPFKYAVFNAGPRLCAGKKFAYLQMKMVAASILLRYRVKVAEGQVIVPKVTTTLYMKHGLLVTFEPRPNA